MFIVVWVLPILIGFFLGYIFTTWFLSLLTAVAAIVCAFLFTVNYPRGDLAGVLPWIVTVPTATGTLTMWITHFIVTKQTWMIDWIPNIFRT